MRYCQQHARIGEKWQQNCQKMAIKIEIREIIMCD